MYLRVAGSYIRRRWLEHIQIYSTEIFTYIRCMGPRYERTSQLSDGSRTTIIQIMWYVKTIVLRTLPVGTSATFLSALEMNWWKCMKTGTNSNTDNSDISNFQGLINSSSILFPICIYASKGFIYFHQFTCTKHQFRNVSNCMAEIPSLTKPVLQCVWKWWVTMIGWQRVLMLLEYCRILCESSMPAFRG